MANRTAIGEIIKVLGQRDQRKNVSITTKPEAGGGNNWVNPSNHHSTHEFGGADALPVSDNMIGDRTVSDSATPTGDTGKTTTLFGWLANMIKQITGKANWRTAPAITLEATNTHVTNEPIHVHVRVRLASTGAVTLNGTQTVDGIATNGGDRILIKDQADKKTNGIYVASSSGAWSRASDFDAAADIVSGASIYVMDGSTLLKKTYNLTSVDPVLGVDDLVFEAPAGGTGGGSAWYDGSGAPAGGTGIDGDYYLDTDNGDVYTKSSGSWSVTGNIKGTTGAAGIDGTDGIDGTNGSVWHSGSGVPDDGTGINGDYYLRTSNGDVYTKAAGTWGSPTGNIKGATGATGAAGSIGDYAENSGSHSGLDFAYNAGKVRANNVIHTTAAGSITLANNTTNYIEVNPTSGAISRSTVGFTSDLTPLFTVVTSGGAIITVTDCRCFFNSGGTGIAWFSTASLPTITSVTTGLAITAITKP
jgi:hypothetical protein